MSDFLYTRQKKYVHGLCVLGGILAILIIVFAGYRSFRRFFSGFSRDFMRPYLNSVVRTEDKTAAAALMLKSKTELARQLAATARENARLAAENSSLKTLETENARLRTLMRLPVKQGFRPVFAEVLTRAVPTWRETFVINRGRMEGIAPGDLVVAADENGRLAAAGRIKDVSSRTATVVTLFSDECRLSVILASSHHAGGLEFDVNARVPKVKYLPADGTYAERETVVTSGVTANTPHGLPVGMVTKSANGNIATIRNQMYAEVEVKPLLTMDVVKYVAVYTKRGAK